jgi:hypothetical protein
MCRILIAGNDFPIANNGKNVHLPKETRIALINQLAEKRCPMTNVYKNALHKGTLGVTDCYGGLTITNGKWTELINDLNLELINKDQKEKTKNLPGVAA